jgi:hypothetical protein
MAKLGEYGDKIETMTAQEVFDVAATHLLEQGERSKDDSFNCQYDGGSVCCAAAPFIKNYTSDMENSTYPEVVTGYGQPDTHETLVAQLQIIHDTTEVEEWKGELLRLAERNKLSPDVLSTFPDVS